MKVSKVKQEYQLQEWRGLIQQRQESGLSVRQWCQEHGMKEDAYYYRLRRLRERACEALEEVQSTELAEFPLAPKAAAVSSEVQIRVTTASAVVEVTSPDCAVLEQILRVLVHA